jgi:hypothetical protein
LNKKGHSKSLVPAHPGNLNAAKTGVFSQRILAARVAEFDTALALQPVEQTVAETLRREVAALMVIGQAMDESIEQDGILGRGREPRNLIQLRLRLNDKLRRTLEQYHNTLPVVPGADTEGETAEDGETVVEEVEPFLATVARFHSRDSIELIQPADFDAEMFLRAVIQTRDPAVSLDDRLRARKLLTKRREQRAEFCVCSATLKTRDEIEFRGWIDEARHAGLEVHSDDAYMATLTRRLASGEQLEPYFRYKRTTRAFEVTMEEGVQRVRGPGGSDDTQKRAQDGTEAPFWKALLSPKPRVTLRQRLKSFSALEEAGALPACTCDRTKEWLAELRDDALFAYIIRSVGQRHYRAAVVIAQFPETYFAVREAIDARVASATARENELQAQSEAKD